MHNASIMVLLFEKTDKRPFLRKFTYCDPFEKKDFAYEGYWLNEEVQISDYVVERMKQVFFEETF